MECLCRNYWYPLYAFVRRKGHRHEDACDLTQAFFARFLEKNYLRSVDSKLGRFRTFLLKAMTHFLANEWDKSRAQKRGGGRPTLSLDEAAANNRYQFELVENASPERIFDRRWAETVMEVVIRRLEAETEITRFEVLKAFLLKDNGEMRYEVAATRLGISVAAITSAIHRLRARYRDLVYQEVADTLSNPDDVRDELRHLLASLND